MFRLSRTTLIYYDSIGLLTPAERSAAGYRIYTESEREKLQIICTYRETGMPLRAVKKLLQSRKTDLIPADILEHRLNQINGLINDLEKQRRVILTMLGNSSNLKEAISSPKKFTDILRSIGFSDKDMQTWHGKLETEMPEFHGDFLTLLGFSPEDINRIRKWSLKK